MGLEAAGFITDINPAWPLGTDQKNQGDDHLRNFKKSVQDSLPNIGGAVNMDHNQLNGFVGMVAAFPIAITSAATKGWLLCDGASYATATYPDLFAAIGYAYGGSGANFNVPDYRGEFLRGTDSAAGRDPDAASRTDRGDGTTGDNVGTKQGDEFKSHNHLQGGSFAAGAGGQGVNDFSGNTVATTLSGGNETRPRNVGVNYYIHI